MSAEGRRWSAAAALCLALAALSTLGPTSPSYDPWAWLVWGREIGHLELDTVDGPAFKPGPVLVTTLLAPLGDGVAPTLWMILARAGGLAAVLAAGLLAHRLAGGPGRPAGSFAHTPATPRRPWWQTGWRMTRSLRRRWLPRLPWTPRRRRRTGPAAAAAATRDGALRRDEVRVLAARRAAVLAAVAVAATDGLLWQAWQGTGEGLATAFALLAVERALAGRPRAALGLAAALCLLRVEAWPFAAAYAAHLAWTRPAWRPALAAAAVAIPVLWFGPELWGSGDLLRSGDRARVPNPGQPALADVPALASLGDALALPLAAALVAVALGAATLRPGVALPLTLGAGWLGLVAVMAQAGFSGEERYHLPGVAALGVAAAVALAGILRRRDARWAAAGAVLAVALAGQAAARATGVPARLDRQEHAERLSDDLGRAIAAAGGRRAVLRCGRPVTGPLRGPLVAWHLRVPKQRVAFDPRAAGTGAVLRSRLLPGAPVEPPPDAGPRGRTVGAGEWAVTLAPRC